MDICEQIRRERGASITRCGVIDAQMSVSETARAFGLDEDDAIYRRVGRTEAEAIISDVLHADLAYGVTIMSVSRAADLWQQFMSLFDGQDVHFVTNVADLEKSWMPATQATFDMGVLVIGATKVGCLWVEGED